jgi:AMP nucleosidase
MPSSASAKTGSTRLATRRQIVENWLPRYTGVGLDELGDHILPIAAIRGDGTSNDYFPPEVPALPAFALQKAISTTIREAERDYWTGTVYTTNRRVWEHDEEFKAHLFRRT